MKNFAWKRTRKIQNLLDLHYATIATICCVQSLRFYHWTKDHIFFFQMLWKDSLSKKITLEYDLSCIITQDGISFSRKYDVVLWTENKRWSFSKNTRKYDVFFKCFEKMVFPKKSHWNMTFLASSGKMTSVFLETMIFFLWWKTNDGLSKKVHGNMMFSVHSIKMVLLFPTNYEIILLSKKRRWSSPEKYT